jgi:hypothetical protein
MRPLMASIVARWPLRTILPDAPLPPKPVSMSTAVASASLIVPETSGGAGQAGDLGRDWRCR